jgi:hypothetical protein
MFRKLRILIPWTLVLTVTSGCDDRATRTAREAADRQAQQNNAMAELNKEVASGTHELVKADGQARKEIVGVHRDLQAERTRLDSGWSELNDERRQVASQRRTESLLVAVVQYAGGILLLVVLLGFSWYALVAAGRSNADAQLNELLVCEILPDESLLLSLDERSPALLDRPLPNESAS